MDKAISLSEVAAAAGVSPTTVSHVISGRRPVSAQTASKVRSAMEQLGFVPNHAAQSLATGSTRTIGLLVPDIANSFFAELTRGIEDGAERAGFSVLMGNTDFDATREARYLNAMRGRHLDGLIYAAGSPPDLIDLRRLAAETPLALVDEEVPSLAELTVVADNAEGGRAVATMLRDLGHRRALVISGPPRLRSSLDRVVAFRKVFEHAGGEVVLREGDFRELSGQLLTKRALAEDPDLTAVFALNDLMAIGAYRAVTDLGLRIPEDVSVVGYDAIAIGSMLSPPLTSVRQPVHEMGEIVVRELIARIGAPRDSVPARIVVPVEVVFGGSAGARRSVRRVADVG